VSFDDFLAPGDRNEYLFLFAAFQLTFSKSSLAKLFDSIVLLLFISPMAGDDMG
jgi:hypothetical protein